MVEGCCDNCERSSGELRPWWHLYLCPTCYREASEEYPIGYWEDYLDEEEPNE